MIDLLSFQRSFLLGWAEKLLTGPQEDWKYAASKSFEKVGGTSAFMSNLRSDSFKGLDLVYNSFWKEVLSVWLDNRKPNDLSQMICLDSPLFNNEMIKLKNSVLFFP